VRESRLVSSDDGRTFYITVVSFSVPLSIYLRKDFVFNVYAEHVLDMQI
jgi:hypothetical protein